MARTRRETADPTSAPAPWVAVALGMVALLTEVAVLPGAASSFRLPKEVVATAGLAVVAAAALVGALRRRSIPVPRGPLVAVLAVLPLIQLASAAWAPSPHRAVTDAAVTAVWVLGMFLVATLPEAARRRVAVWCALGAAISVGVLLVQAAGVPIFDFADELSGRFRLTGLAGNPADMATAAVLLLPLLLGRKEDLAGVLRPALAALLVLGALLTVTLTAYAALAALLLAWLTYARSRRAWAVAATALVAAVAVALAAGFGWRLEQRLAYLRGGDWYALLSARGDGWTAASEMVRSRPLLGVGAGNYTQLFYPSRLAWLDRHDQVGRRGELATHFEWAHCDPLQLAAELGVPGVLWMAALAWGVARVRTRAAPLPALAAAAALPFLLLHYPTHLAVGVLPMALIVGELLAVEEVASVRLRGRALRAAAGVVAVATAAVTVGWQLQRLTLSDWQAEIEARLEAVQRAPEAARRTQLAAALEAQILPRIGALPGTAPWLWRVVGKARLVAGDAAGAADAFRTSAALWPHAEADLGLGLALAAEGRRTEGLVYLGRVARVNPELVDLIRDPDLRRAVTDLTNALHRR